MDRFQPISITNSSLGAHLYPSEEVYLLTENVGLYSGPYKSLPHSSGTVYLTSHRLFYIDDNQPHVHSCFLQLEIIKETQHYAGFLKSSPKVTLGFKKAGEESDKGDAIGGAAAQTNGMNSDWRQKATVSDNDALVLEGPPTKSWTCRICAFRNTMESSTPSQGSAVKCQLCGVTSQMKDIVLEEPKPSPNGDTTTSGKSISAAMTASKDGISCPTCTFANHPSMSRCEICDTLLGTNDVAQLKREASRKLPDSIGSSRAQTPVLKEQEAERHDSVRLSFRKGGDKALYSTLKSTLLQKSWQKSAAVNGASASNRDRFSSTHRNIDGRSASSALDGGTSGGNVKRVGIEAVFSAVDLQAREESDDMRDAFRDLEALMARAKKMVDLAETLNAKLTRQEASGKGAGVEGQDDDEAANIIRSSLVRLGLPTPAITSDMAKDEMEYNLQLAQELAGLLYTGPSPLMGKGRVIKKPISDDLQSSKEATVVEGSGPGVMPLDELWCMWNRARGVALVSPKSLLAVCQVLPKITSPPIDCKTFQSGLRILHTAKYRPSRFSKRILSFLQDEKRKEAKQQREIEEYGMGFSTMEIAKMENCPLHLVTELLQEVEYELGTLVRDESSGQLTWYENQITSFDWDSWQINRK
jgi:ESCRT-II complex subunit VPS36